MVGLAWDLLARDNASPAFLRLAAAGDKAATSTARASASLRSSTAKMAATGATLTKKVTLPILAVGAVSVAQAAKYKKSMTLIQTVTGQTAGSMQQTSKGLLNIAKSTGTTLDQLTNGLYTVEKGGLRGSNALAAVKAAAEGAKAENVDLATSTSALTSIMASYGKQLSDPVAAMNEIIKGSGLAKTTMQDFAGSLSNVVPLAASLHIGFDQVAGAIDTMTQHGETAQRATDNLSNLITNLAGQNNVASQSLQQLGVNTISLSKNLGTRGLTGTLNTVLAAIAKHGKSGLVVTSAFKEAATATRSLQTELGAMPKTLRTNASAFDSGKMSYKDFYKYAKSLGGQQYQMAKQFISTEATAKGFNNQLKSGNSTTRTLAATLQKSLGGVTGMRVALMLSGSSAKTFAADTAAVAKAATSTKGDVLGWANTQDTLAVKLDKAKAAMQVTAVQIGNLLLPAVSKIAGAVSGAVGAFSNLSAGKQKFIVFTAAAIAAVGPVLSIFSRLILLGSRVASVPKTIAGGFAKISGMSTSTAATVQRGVGVMTAALAGAAIGTAVGTLTQNASGAVKAIGLIGSAAAGAAVGFGAGGPIGAAVGGLTGLLSGAVSAFHLFGSSAKAQIKPTEALTQAIYDDGDALGKLTRVQTFNMLQSKGLYDAALKLGIRQSTLTDAALGNAKAQGTVNAALQSQGLIAGAAYASGKKLTQVQYDQSQAAGKLTSGLAFVGQTLAVNKKAAENETAALGKSSSATKAAGASANKAAGQTNNLYAALSKVHSKQITITAKDNATSAVNKVKQAIALLENKQITITAYERIVGITGPHGSADTNDGKGRNTRATGGIIRGPGTGTSDTAGVFALSNGEAVIPARAVSRHPGIVNALIASGRGMAKGGKVDQSTLSTAASTAIGNIGSAAGSKFYVTDVGVNRIINQISSAWSVLQKQIGKGLSANAAKSYKNQLVSYTRLAQSQLASLRVKVKSSDVNAIRTALGGTADDVRSAFSTLFTDARNAGFTAANIKSLQNRESDLLRKQSAIASAASKLSTMRDYQSGITSTLTGAFDPTQYGSSVDLRAGLASATGTNNAYASEVNSLRRRLKGNKSGLSLLNTLAASGQTATLQTLAGASSKDLSADVAAYARYQTSVSSGGNAATLAKYGETVTQQVQTLAREQHDMSTAVSHLATAVGQLAKGHNVDKQLEAAIRQITATAKKGRKK